MSCHHPVYQWTRLVTTHFPHLSKPQARVLALWSLGLVVARSCALSAVSTLLAQWLDRKANTVRQQLREFCYEAAAKRGAHRQEVVVETCFVPLLKWVLSWWEGPQLALALDATTLGQRFVVLALSVLYRGCAIPVAWTVLPAGKKHAWRQEWLRMLRRCARPCHGASSSWSWPIGGCMRAGCIGASCGWAGIRCCASISGAPFGPQPVLGIDRCAASCPSSAPSGPAVGPPLSVRAVASIAPCWRGGRRATPIPGCY
jgi:hypothetical protein